ICVFVGNALHGQINQFRRNLEWRTYRKLTPSLQATITSRTRCPFMDQRQTREHLETAKQHVAAGKKHIAKQREIIAELERDKHPTKLAISLLNTMLETQIMHEADYDRLAKLLDMKNEHAASEHAASVASGGDTKKN